MRCPKWLTDEAAEFWGKHWSRLVKEGSVDEERDADGFALLCNVYRLLRTTAPLALTDSKQAILHMAALKQYQSMGKQYGLMPKDRKASGFDAPTSIADINRKALEG